MKVCSYSEVCISDMTDVCLIIHSSAPCPAGCVCVCVCLCVCREGVGVTVVGLC